MTPRAELKTARLTLRPVALGDERAAVAALNHLDVTGWLSLVPYPYTAGDFHHFRAEIAVSGQDYAVQDASGFVGVVGIGGGKGLGREIGYWFAPHAHGKGYATEAARAVLAEHMSCNQDDVVSGYFEGNAGSANVLRKLGFVRVGHGMRPCRALGIDRPHIDLRLTKAAFVASLQEGSKI